MPQRVAECIELSTASQGVEPGHPAGVDKPAMGGCVNRLSGRWGANVHIFAEWGELSRMLQKSPKVYIS